MMKNAPERHVKSIKTCFVGGTHLHHSASGKPAERSNAGWSTAWFFNALRNFSPMYRQILF